MNLTENELIRLVRERVDPDDIVEILQLTSSDLAEAFSHKLIDHSKEIQEFTNMEDYTELNDDIPEDEDIMEELEVYLNGTEDIAEYKDSIAEYDNDGEGC